MPRILVVDDDPTVMDTSGLVLGHAGHEVTVVDRGAAALSALRSRRFDLVLSDYRLPDFSGLDLLRLVRSDSNPVPFVIITGFGSSDCAVQAMKLGAADFIEKPVDVDQLTDLAARYAASGPGSSPAPTPPQRQLPDAQTHAADRWARAVMEVVRAGADPRRLEDWAGLLGSSVGALRTRCRVAGLNARRSLAFARLLRVVILAEHEGRYPEQFLDNVDPRTVDRLLALGCLPHHSEHNARPTANGFLARQTIIAEPHALSAIRRTLGSGGR